MKNNNNDMVVKDYVPINLRDITFNEKSSKIEVKFNNNNKGN